jgi:hypothetical protein
MPSVDRCTCRPARVVEDHEEHRQLHRFGDEVRGRRIAEHVRPVADRADHGFPGSGQLRSQRGAEAPAEAARRRAGKVAARLAHDHLFQHQRIFVDEDRVSILQRIETRGCVLRREARRRLRAPRAGLLPRGFVSFRDLIAPRREV